MKCRVYGEGHLAETLQKELQLHRVEYSSHSEGSVDVAFVAEDILDHDDATQLNRVSDLIEVAANKCQCVVVLSQVPPGWIRIYGDAIRLPGVLYYQVDTIIVRHAVARMMRPAQIIVGCLNPAAPLDLAYQAYLTLHDCPVLQMSYESAELAKCAFNYALSTQIEMSNMLSLAADACGADYADVAHALRGDARIGGQAYLRPGKPNQHLNRDVTTIRRLIKEASLA